MTRQRQRWMATAAAVTAVVALLGWWALFVHQAPAVRPAHLGTSWMLARLAASAPDRADLPTSRTQGARFNSTDPDSFELCGLGRVARKDLEEGSGANETLSRLEDEAMRRTVERLRAQRDERSRAVAQLLLWAAEWRNEAKAAQRRAFGGGECDKEPCDVQPGPAVERDALARLAAGTSDPWVYGLAYQACAWQLMDGRAGACQLISVERWAQLEPDNAVPWLFAASEAHQRKDAPGVDEAMYRASQARRSDRRFAHSVLVMQAQVPEDVAPALSSILDVGLVGIESAFAMPGYQTVSQYCVKEALGDPNRRSTCDGLATMLTERGDGVIDLAVGLGMAKRLDWPAERLAPIEELRDAITGYQMGSAAVEQLMSSPFGCATVQTQRTQLRQMASQGELATYKGLVDASSLGRTGLAAQRREAQVRMRQQHEAKAAVEAGTASSAEPNAGASAAPAN